MTTSLLALAILPFASAAAPAPDYAEPYRILQQANLVLDPALAASSYASDAKLIFDYPGQPPATFQGRDAIRSSFVRTFGQVDADQPIKIEFRFAAPGLASDRQEGAYRIDAQVADRPIVVFGRFSVRLVLEKGSWRFAEDQGMPATATDFDKLPPSELGHK